MIYLVNCVGLLVLLQFKFIRNCVTLMGNFFKDNGESKFFSFQVFFNLLMTDHDANVFNPPSTHTMARVDHWIEILLSGLTNWDAVYFLHIAEFGYSYENTLAFFPLFPLTVYIVSNTVLMPLQFVMNYRSVIMISAFLLNMLFFVLAARSLYKLSLLVLKDKSLAYRAAQLFCINPASIFFTAAYSEPIYAFLAFTGMFVVESGDNINGSLWFGFSALARSNGLVNFGFVLYKDFHNFICDLSAVIKGSYEDANTQLLSGIFSKTYQRLLSTLLSLCLCCIPFFLYQYYSYTVFCNTTASYKDLKNHVLNYGNTMSYKMAHAGLSPWCFQTVPISYSYIQNTHWNVGFLKYYELKQIPNFLLATPAVLIILFAFLAYFGRHPVYVLSQGIIKPCKEAETDKKTDLPASSCRCGFYSLRTHSYIVHVMALVVFGALFMHVQVSLFVSFPEQY